jgi:prepilin-type processing-associated H-X9-DG protein
VEPDRGIFNLNASGFVEGAYPTGWAMPLPNPDGRVPILYVDGHSDLMLWEELKERRREIIGSKPFNARW